MKNKEQKKHPNIVFIISSAICFILLIAFCINVFNMKESVIIPQCYVDQWRQIAMLPFFIISSIAYFIPYTENVPIIAWIIFIAVVIVMFWLAITLITYILNKKFDKPILYQMSKIFSTGTKIFFISLIFALILLLVTPFAIKTKCNVFLLCRDVESPTVTIDGATKSVSQMQYSYSYGGIAGGGFSQTWDFDNGIYYYRDSNHNGWFYYDSRTGSTFNEKYAQEFIDALANSGVLKSPERYPNKFDIEGVAWSVTFSFSDGTEKRYYNTGDGLGSDQWENVFDEYFETKLQ